MQTLKSREEAGVLIITLDDLPALGDKHSADFRDALYELVEESRHRAAIIDVSAVKFVSSSGIALLIGLKRRFDQRGIPFILFGVRSHPLEALTVMKLDRFFTIAPDLSTAMKLASDAITPPDSLDTVSPLSS